MNNIETICVALAEDILNNRPRNHDQQAEKYSEDDRKKLCEIIEKQKEFAVQFWKKHNMLENKHVLKLYDGLTALLTERVL